MVDKRAHSLKHSYKTFFKTVKSYKFERLQKISLARSNFKKLKVLIIDEAKQKHVLKLIERFKNNPNRFWKDIGLESRSSVSMNIDEETLTNHYTDIYNNMQQTDESKILEKMQEAIVNDYVKEIHGTIGEANITLEYMKDIIKSLKRNKKPGHSGVNNEMIKAASETILMNRLADLMNLMLNHCVCPNDLNIGVVVTLIKDAQGDNKRTQ
jgi:hypothetical protein